MEINDMGYVTSKELTGNEGATGVARSNKIRLDKAIEDLIEKRVEEETDKKRKESTKEKKST